MKALDCPSCGAPVSLKKGIKKYKCSFCENELYPDYENALEFNGLSEKEYKKLTKRADDAFARGLIEKAKAQYLTLSELLKEDYERYNHYMRIKARYHRLKIHDFIVGNYDIPDGVTIVDVQNRASAADVDNPPEFYYARIDGPIMEIIEEIEDECEGILELENEKTLEEGTSQAFGIFCYLEIDTLLSNVIPQACDHIYLNCSYNHEPGGNQYGSWIDNKALAGPVYLALQIHAEYLGIMMKFLENIDIGDDYSDKSLCAVPLWTKATELLRGVNLHQIQIDKRHPKSDYTLDAIKDVPSVREFFISFEKLNDKLRPTLEKAIKRAKEKELLELKEKQKLKEKEKRESERKRKEWLESPEYATVKKIQKITFLSLGGVMGLILIFGIANEFLNKNGSDLNKAQVDEKLPTLKETKRYVKKTKRDIIEQKEKSIELKRLERLKRLEERKKLSLQLEESKRLEEVKKLQDIQNAKSSMQDSYNKLFSNEVASKLIFECSKEGSNYFDYYSFGMLNSANKSFINCLFSKVKQNDNSNQPISLILNKCITEKPVSYNWSLFENNPIDRKLMNRCLEEKKWDLLIPKN